MAFEVGKEYKYWYSKTETFGSVLFKVDTWLNDEMFLATVVGGALQYLFKADGTPLGHKGCNYSYTVDWKLFEPKPLFGKRIYNDGAVDHYNVSIYPGSDNYFDRVLSFINIENGKASIISVDQAKKRLGV